MNFPLHHGLKGPATPWQPSRLKKPCNSTHHLCGVSHCGVTLSLQHGLQPSVLYSLIDLALASCELPRCPSFRFYQQTHDVHLTASRTTQTRVWLLQHPWPHVLVPASSLMLHTTHRLTSEWHTTTFVSHEFLLHSRVLKSGRLHLTPVMHLLASMGAPSFVHNSHLILKMTL
eukprot:Gb_02596 [translate_table: standard]